MKKYEFTGETKQYFNKTLKRIRRISDGLLGGWIEKEENLSQSGNCFIYNNAKVYDNARICGDASIYGNAKVYANSKIHDNAIVCGNAVIHGNAKIYDNAKIYGNVEVCNNTIVLGNTKLYDDTKVIGDTIIIEEIKIHYKQVDFFQCNNTRLATVVLAQDDKLLFNIDNKKFITKEEFINKINLKKHNEKKLYLKILNLINFYNRHIFI